jgi:hypothetical protein
MDRGSKVSEDGRNGDNNALRQVCCSRRSVSRRHLTTQAWVRVTWERASSEQAYCGLLLAGSFHQCSILVFYSSTTDAIQSKQLTGSVNNTLQHT